MNGTFSQTRPYHVVCWNICWQKADGKKKRKMGPELIRSFQKRDVTSREPLGFFSARNASRARGKCQRWVRLVGGTCVLPWFRKGPLKSPSGKAKVSINEGSCFIFLSYPLIKACSRTPISTICFLFWNRRQVHLSLLETDLKCLSCDRFVISTVIKEPLVNMPTHDI